MVQPITPQRAFELISRGEVDVVDVREPNEWSTGHLDVARHIPLAKFRANPKASLLRDGVVFICAAGMRSDAAARLAASSGMKVVYNLTGGMRAWLKAGLPLEAAPAAVTAAE